MGVYIHKELYRGHSYTVLLVSVMGGLHWEQKGSYLAGKLRVF